MKINANFHAINKYCMKKNLTPNSDLSYWLQFGFPKETKTIEIEKYTTVGAPIKPKQKNGKKYLYLNTLITFGKYEGFTMFSIIEGNPNYAKWLVSIWDGTVSDEVSNILKKK